MIHNRWKFGMVSMLIIIPILIISSLILQFVSITQPYINDQSILDSCSAEEDLCITAKVFSGLSLALTGIIVIWLLILLFCSMETEIFRKRPRKKLCFRSFATQQVFTRYHNWLLILLPLIFVCQSIALGTETELRTGEDNSFQSGFSTYVVSMIVIVIAFFMHPVINQVK